MQIEQMNRQQLEKYIADMEQRIAAFIHSKAPNTATEKEKFRVQMRLLRAAQLELSRRDAESNDIPF